MKKLQVCMIVVLIGIAPGIKAQDPITLIIKQGIKKVIIAVDLKIQRLQTKTIWLQNVQKVEENAMSKLKLNQITDWVQKQKDLYQNYFNELRKVKDVLSYYHRIKEITQQQIALVKEYHEAWNGVQQDGHFAPNEVLYIGQVYTGIIDASLKNLDQIALVINSFTTQMTDAKRMEIINRAADAMQTNLNDLRSFNSQNILLSLQRSKDENDVAVVKKMYGLQ
ncbi:MAG TPA: conjugal transfer protein TraI [Hanamia sp.]|nr:conjugal transfer protein TraI [Hanamia sp.]